MLRQARSKIRISFPLVAMAAHDCVPNTFRCVDGRAERGADGFAQELRAREDIKKGDSITISYADTLLPTPLRRANLARDKKFECGCKRCMDPTELGSHCGALRCEEWCQGAMLPVAKFTSWTCQKCKEGKKAAADAESLMKEVYRGIRHKTACVSALLIYLPPNLIPTRINGPAVRHQPLDGGGVRGVHLEAQGPARPAEWAADRRQVQVRRLSTLKGAFTYIYIVHMYVAFRLCGMYGRCPGFEVPFLTEFHLSRKMQLCKESLDVLDAIEPGLSSVRGMVLYEAHLPYVMLSQMYLQIGKISMQASGAEFKKGN